MRQSVLLGGDRVWARRQRHKSGSTRMMHDGHRAGVVDGGDSNVSRDSRPMGIETTLCDGRTCADCMSPHSAGVQWGRRHEAAARSQTRPSHKEASNEALVARWKSGDDAHRAYLRSSHAAANSNSSSISLSLPHRSMHAPSRLPREFHTPEAASAALIREIRSLLGARPCARRRLGQCFTFVHVQCRCRVSLWSELSQDWSHWCWRIIQGIGPCRAAGMRIW